MPVYLLNKTSIQRHCVSVFISCLYSLYKIAFLLHHQMGFKQTRCQSEVLFSFHGSVDIWKRHSDPKGDARNSTSESIACLIKWLNAQPTDTRTALPTTSASDTCECSQQRARFMDDIILHPSIYRSTHLQRPTALTHWSLIYLK